MQTRPFGQSGLKLSVLGFGCGAVGGLMVRGSAADQERAVARAVDAGISYFDTAAQYGDGQSETNLGRVIKTLKLRDITIGTKVRLTATSGIRDAIVASLDNSLQRLDLPNVDIFHLHNAITERGQNGALTADQVLNEVVPTFENLRQQGKIRFCGITAVGDIADIRKVAEARVINSAQVVFNLLNPSAAGRVSERYPGQNFQELLKLNTACGIGSIAIRILGGWRAVGLGDAATQRESGAGADRIVVRVRRRSCARAKVCAAGCRWLARQSHRARDPLRDHRAECWNGADRARFAAGPRYGHRVSREGSAVARGSRACCGHPG